MTCRGILFSASLSSLTLLGINFYFKSFSSASSYGRGATQDSSFQTDSKNVLDCLGDLIKTLFTSFTKDMHPFLCCSINLNSFNIKTSLPER